MIAIWNRYVLIATAKRFVLANDKLRRWKFSINQAIEEISSRTFSPICFKTTINLSQIDVMRIKIIIASCRFFSSFRDHNSIKLKTNIP